jgi:hypothetical protein
MEDLLLFSLCHNGIFCFSSSIEQIFYIIPPFFTVISIFLSSFFSTIQYISFILSFYFSKFFPKICLAFYIQHHHYYSSGNSINIIFSHFCHFSYLFFIWFVSVVDPQWFQCGSGSQFVFQLEKTYFFLKIEVYFSLGLHEGRLSYKEKPPALKREHPAFEIIHSVSPRADLKVINS